VLEYDDAGGTHHERPVVEVPKELSRGFYVNAGPDVVGVFASPRGPVFFVNDQRYPMHDPTFAVELHPGEKENLFIARHDSDPVFLVRYPRHTNWGYDNWSAEEDSADWYLWLRNQAATERFHAFYTTAS
jgi:hypothetical protein